MISVPSEARLALRSKIAVGRPCNGSCATTAASCSPGARHARRALSRASYASMVGVCMSPAGLWRADAAMAREHAYGSTVSATSRTTVSLNERRLNTSCAWRLVEGNMYSTGSVGVRNALAFPSARCVNPDCPGNSSIVETSNVSWVRASQRVQRREAGSRA
jgi:hypothetical protein